MCRGPVNGSHGHVRALRVPLDSDDLASPGMLGRMADKLDQHPEAEVCFGDYIEFGESELMRAVPAIIDPYRLAYTNEYPVSSMFRRSVLDEVGGRVTMRAYEDWHLWMTLAERGSIAVHMGPGGSHTAGASTEPASGPPRGASTPSCTPA